MAQKDSGLLELAAIIVAAAPFVGGCYLIGTYGGKSERPQPTTRAEAARQISDDYNIPIEDVQRAIYRVEQGKR